MMVTKLGRLFLYCFCIIGFMVQCWQIFFKFLDGTTTTIISNIEPTNDQLEFPRFSICLDPPMSASRLAELGISQRAWDLQNDGNVDWPITSKNQSTLFDRCTYSFKEVFRNVHIGHPIGKSEHFSSAKLLWKETNTMANGKCFTFIGDDAYSMWNSYIYLTINNVFDEGKGQFRLYIHDQGMELSLVNQWWLSTNQWFVDISPGLYTDIILEKLLVRKISRKHGRKSACRQDWKSIDFYNCIDLLTAKAREPFSCRTPFDLALNQSTWVEAKPVCTAFSDIKSLIKNQTSVFWSLQNDNPCSESCELVSYKPSISSNKLFHGSHTMIYIYYSTLNTILKEEILAYDLITTISALGGSLGLFLGFSVLGVGLTVIKRIHKPVLDTSPA